MPILRIVSTVATVISSFSPWYVSLLERGLLDDVFHRRYFEWLATPARETTQGLEKDLTRTSVTTSSDGPFREATYSINRRRERSKKALPLLTGPLEVRNSLCSKNDSVCAILRENLEQRLFYGGCRSAFREHYPDFVERCEL